MANIFGKRQRAQCVPAVPSARTPRDDATASDKPPREAVGILVVEDDYLVASDIEAALVEAGLDIAGIATTADEAMELAGSHHPALVVMDIRLAGVRDGVDAALELFTRYGIRCVFATAHYDREVRARAGPARPLGWLQKPYSMTSLVESIRQALHDLADDTS
jgi:two-component system, response regulator PdtaR